MRRLVVAVSALMLLATAGCVVAQVPWPNLNEAEGHLNAALGALQRAPDRFGGHKAQAERLIQQAMNEIELAKRDFH